MEDKQSLEARIVTLTKKSRKLEDKVTSLEGKLRSASDSYQQLLERLDAGSSNLHDSTLHDPVVALVMSIDPSPLLDEQMIDKPQKLFYRKADWTNEKKRTRGVLDALDVDDISGPGPCHYLIQKDRSVASGEDQETMRNEARAAWTTMKIYGHCGTTWTKTDTFGQTFFYRHMRAHFSEFRYCVHDWKARQFATTYFPAWSGKPEEDPGIKTESVKVESALDIKMEHFSSTAPLQRLSSAKSKCPPSLTIFTLAIQRVPSLPSSSTAVVRPLVAAGTLFVNKGKNCAVQIISPLAHTADQYSTSTNLNADIVSLGQTADQHMSADLDADIIPLEQPNSLTIVEQEDNYEGIVDTHIHSIFESNTSPTDSKMICSVPELAPTSPPPSASIHSLLENLASSLKTPVTGPITPAFANVTLADIPIIHPVGLGMQPPAASMPPLMGIPKKKKESNLNAVLRPTKSNTARNLCAIAYKEQNKGRAVTVGEFAAYWDNMSEEMRKPFVDQVEQIKRAKASAIECATGSMVNNSHPQE